MIVTRIELIIRNEAISVVFNQMQIADDPPMSLLFAIFCLTISYKIFEKLDMELG